MAPTSESELILVDPDGDLILKVGSERGTAEESEPNASQNSSDGPEAATQEVAENKRPSTLRIRVCSKFMTMCSPVFNAMLSGSFREGQLPLSPLEPPTLELPEDDPRSMVELCRILHHKWDPRLEAFPFGVLETAIVADKYGCSAIARSWFHHRFLRETAKKSGYSRLDLAQLIKISYVLDDVEAFYFLTLEAYKRWPTKKNKSDVFISELSRIPPLPKVHEILEQIAIAQLRELTTCCYEILSVLCEDRRVWGGLGAHSTISTFEREEGVPKVCDGQAYRMAQFIQALYEFGLSLPLDNYRKPATLEEAICIVRQIAKSHVKDTLVPCVNTNCYSCETAWDEVIEDMAEKFENELHGICLVCLRRGDFTACKIVTKCTEHNDGFASGWSMNSGRDTRNFEKLTE
ncbi:uncharacterized protein PV07_11613 [Cladophialophora immunda]|uniref:BTB domain-containing protein n=1 Tax=Cladophialophora immunda TaxID=569365 RepID=A0A0D2CIL9_9EURO|nr:uncharacterized protein PV07_11613 [Cladophialophora immunda]KIW23414.1 hypothetical protein PV07_11613 [Cladophialophora immunda]